MQNGPTRNDILSSDSENEAEAVTKNAQTSAERAQTSAESAETSAEIAQTSAERAQTSAESAQTSGEQVPRPSSNATRLSYLASLAPEERERHLVDFHITYARANKPPAKKKTPLKSKKVPHASNTNNLDQPESIPNKRGRKKLPRDSNGKIIRN